MSKTSKLGEEPMQLIRQGDVILLPVQQSEGQSAKNYQVMVNAQLSAEKRLMVPSHLKDNKMNMVSIYAL